MENVLILSSLITCYDAGSGICSYMHIACVPASKLTFANSGPKFWRWTFSSWMEAPPQKVSPNSHKRGCSGRLSLHGRRKKREGEGRERERKSLFFPSSQSSTLLGTRLCLQNVKFFTDSTFFRFD